LLLCGASVKHARADDLFRDQIAPIFEQRCIRCHAGDKPKGGLALDSAAAASKGGESGAAWIAGKPNESLLVEHISGPKPEMPQGEPALSAQQVGLVVKWISQGASFPAELKLVAKKMERGDWWSFKPLVKPAVPTPALTGWGRTPIDAFALEKLAQQKLTPSPEADRRTQIRRLSFDLIGLPPSPEEVDAFVADTRADAYEQLVDRLLASPRYGERWGRHWLDVVHYGDTHGYDKDKRRVNAWPYRDYVIRAFNEDKPYSKFVSEQIAGDVLQPGDPEGIVATGFIAAGPWDFVGHVELREDTTDKLITRLLDRDDMLANTMSTFTSLTVHCSRCHDHPFDPMTQDDYYSLQAVFAGLDRGDRFFGDKETKARQNALANEKAALQKRVAEIEAKVAGAASPEIARLDEEVAKRRNRLSSLPSPVPPASAPVTSPTNGYHSGIMGQPDGVKWVQIDLAKPQPIEAIHLFPARPTDFRDAPGFGFPVRYQVAVSDEPDFKQPRLAADYSKADVPNPGDNVVSIRLAGETPVVARYVRVTAQRLWLRSGDYIFALGEMQVESGGKNIAAGVTVTALDSIDQGRWHTKNLVDGHNSRHLLPDLGTPELAKTLKDRAALEAELAAVTAERTRAIEAAIGPELRAEQSRATARIRAIEPEMAELSKGPVVYTVVPRAPRLVNWLPRGDVKNPGKEMQAGTVACVPGTGGAFTLTNAGDEGQRRAALAAWLVDSKNVLTWRSIVNRVWHYHFGQGLVDSPNDFGRMGSQPSHPELLDWLAVEFRDGGQSLKKLHRLIVTSAAYRQASTSREDAAKIDSGNRYLWRMNRRRLDAESLRDTVLAVSGRLDLKMGGPGFQAFGFKDDHSPHYLYDQHNVDDPRSFRRAIYRFVVRSVPDPFMECMDSPDPSLIVPVRTETITALQALALLNNPFMVRQAEHFAARVTPITETPEGRATAAWRFAFGRSPSKDETELLVGHAKEHGWASACRLLFNTNEFLFVD